MFTVYLIWYVIHALLKMFTAYLIYKSKLRKIQKTNEVM